MPPFGPWTPAHFIITPRLPPFPPPPLLFPRGVPDEAAAPPLPPFSHVPRPYTGPSAADVLKLRKEHLSPALFHYYSKPLMLVEGKGQYVYDELGRRYLDVRHFFPMSCLWVAIQACSYLFYIYSV